MAFPVKSTPSVLNALVVRVRSPELTALALKVGVLVGTANAGVAKAAAWLRFLGANLASDISVGIEALASPALAADNLDFTLVCPAAQRAWADIELLANRGTAHVLLRFQWNVCELCKWTRE